MTENQIIERLKDYAEKVNHAVFFQINENGAKELYETLINALSFIYNLQAERNALIAGQESLQKFLVSKEAEIERLTDRVHFLCGKSGALQVEIDKYKAELKETTEKFNCQQHVYADLSDIIRDKNAEIERLKSEIYKWSIQCDAIGDCLNEAVEGAKAEAIKEFAERLKSRTHEISCNTLQVVTKDDIDNLVKEMVGEG